MNQRSYNELIQGLITGNNAVLGQLNQYQAYCLKTLQIKSAQRCSSEMAYDIFIDAVIAFRTNILKGERPDPRYLRAYLARICWNMWMALSRSEERKAKKQTNVKEALYGTAMESPDHLVQGEEEKEQAAEREKKLMEIKEAMKKLSDKCRQILHLFIIEGKSMKEIAERFQMASANVAKTTKSRCYSRLMKEIHGK
jgi:RNA polymerase sigma factor (sigma-70 family)